MILKPMFWMLTIDFLNYDSCSAIILVKFGDAMSHYLKNMEGYTGSDPYDNFDLKDRQSLCDDVVKAKQFMTKYNPVYYKQMRGCQNSVLREWDHANNNDFDIVNYQRWAPSSVEPDPNYLKFQLRLVRFGSKRHNKVKCLQCVNSMTIKWFVTFGGREGVMYLLEPSANKVKAGLRITGIFEPSAVICNQHAEYFYSQFEILTKREMMQSVCYLGTVDVLRLCGAVFDVLSNDGIFVSHITQINYLKRNTRPCVMKCFKMRDELMIATNFLRCSISYEDSGTSSTLVHILADIREPGAVFVFVDEEKDESDSICNLKLLTRVTNVGALLNPVGPKEVKLEAVTDRKDGKCEGYSTRSEEAQRENDREQCRPKESLKKMKSGKSSPTELKNMRKKRYKRHSVRENRRKTSITEDEERDEHSESFYREEDGRTQARNWVRNVKYVQMKGEKTTI